MSDLRVFGYIFLAKTRNLRSCTQINFRPQRFATVANLIARFPEQKHKVRVLNIHCATEVCAPIQTVELLAGKDRVSARRTGWT